MAVSAGSTLVNGEALYAHLIHRDAFERPDLCHYPMLDTLSGGSILVGADGHRPFPESMGGLPLANRVARLEDPAGTWLIFDLNGWETAGRLNQIVPPNPTLVLAGARIESAQRPAELAQKTGLPQEALTETLAPAGLNPPLFAIPIAVGLTFTMGGPLVDEHARVLDADRHPITGLYAAGCAIGGLSGGPRPGYAGGISVAFTLGLLAAEHATSRVTTGVVTGN
jgi:fumarate reductase flavoprotein subunit